MNNISKRFLSIFIISALLVSMLFIAIIFNADAADTTMYNFEQYAVGKTGTMTGNIDVLNGDTTQWTTPVSIIDAADINGGSGNGSTRALKIYNKQTGTSSTTVVYTVSKGLVTTLSGASGIKFWVSSDAAGCGIRFGLGTGTNKILRQVSYTTVPQGGGWIQVDFTGQFYDGNYNNSNKWQNRNITSADLDVATSLQFDLNNIPTLNSVFMDDIVLLTGDVAAITTDTTATASTAATTAVTTTQTTAATTVTTAETTTTAATTTEQTTVTETETSATTSETTTAEPTTITETTTTAETTTAAVQTTTGEQTTIEDTTEAGETTEVQSSLESSEELTTAAAAQTDDSNPNTNGAAPIGIALLAVASGAILLYNKRK